MHRPSKPKRLRVDICPSSLRRADCAENDLIKESSTVTATGSIAQDAYEFDHSKLFLSLTTRRVYRPFPAVATLLAATAQTPTQRSEEQQDDADELQRLKEAEERTGEKMPLLQEFVKALKDRKVIARPDRQEPIADLAKVPASDGEKDDNRSGSVTHPSPLDTTSSILTQGHHKRILEIANSSSFIRDRKEYNKLRLLLREERRLYYSAIQKFREENLDRFLIGFKGENECLTLF